MCKKCGFIYKCQWLDALYLVPFEFLQLHCCVSSNSLLCLALSGFITVTEEEEEEEEEEEQEEEYEEEEDEEDEVNLSLSADEEEEAEAEAAKGETIQGEGINYDTRSEAGSAVSEFTDSNAGLLGCFCDFLICLKLDLKSS